MKVKEIYAALSKRIPSELSCEWDNDGLMVCPDPDREVKRVLIALDITEAVAQKAIDGGYDLILSHHPLIFRPLKALNFDSYVAKKAIRLLCAGVSAMSFHTRLDAVCGGVNDTLANALGLVDVSAFGENGEAIGRIGSLPSTMPLAEFAALVKQVTGAASVTVADAGLPVSRVALLGGSGSDDVAAAKKSGADTYLSGELGHHHLTDAPENGMNLIAAGHFHTENPVCETLRDMLFAIDPTVRAEIVCSNTVYTV